MATSARAVISLQKGLQDPAVKNPGMVAATLVLMLRAVGT
jgi:hypothetical protein